MDSFEKSDGSKSGENPIGEIPEGASWQNPGEFPEFVDKQQKTNIDKLQAFLDRVGFNELRKDDKEFLNFLKTADKQDMLEYLSYINQKLREDSSKGRGLAKGVMAVGNLLSPNRETQIDIFNYEIDALTEMENPKYRAASAYYLINNLHMFPDGNGRTSRTVFELLDDPESNLSEQQQFFSHEDNKDQHVCSEHGAIEFLETKNMIEIEDFNELIMLGYLEKIKSKNEGESFISDLKDNFEARIEEKRYTSVFRLNIDDRGTMTGDTEIPAFNNNSGFNSLREDEKGRIRLALKGGNTTGVSVSALAMLKFYQEKNQQEEFLERTKAKKNPDTFAGFNRDDMWRINIDPAEKESYGHCECEDWSRDDFLHYAELAEHIRKQVLETSVDVFANPDGYKFFNKTIAEVTINAKEFNDKRKTKLEQLQKQFLKKLKEK